MRLTSITRRHSASDVSAAVLVSSMPAQFTSTSMRPCAARTASNRAATELSSATSTSASTAAKPDVRRAAAASAAAALRTSASTTTAPSCAKRRAVASPIPEAAPVTMLTLSCSRMAVSRSLVVLPPANVHRPTRRPSARRRRVHSPVHRCPDTGSRSRPARGARPACCARGLILRPFPPCGGLRFARRAERGPAGQRGEGSRGGRAARPPAAAARRRGGGR